MLTPQRQSRVVPAPLIVGACLGAGWLFHHLHPVRILPSLGLAAPLLGAALGVLGLGIGLAGVRQFHRHQTPTSPFQPTTALVTSGVFRYTRNPMYLGFVVLTLGIALGVNSVAFLLAALVLLVSLQVAVIGPEERFLARRYGAAFAAYKRQTRRWL